MQQKAPLRIAVLGSGKGSNCQSIIDAVEAGTLDAEVVCVLTDVEGAPILARARKHGIPAEYISAAPYRTKLDGEAELRYIEALRRYGIDYYLVGGHAFYAQQEIYDLLNLLRAINSPCDELSLAGALRSPLFGLCDGIARAASRRRVRTAGCGAHRPDLTHRMGC